jgi:hypothetical protein
MIKHSTRLPKYLSTDIIAAVLFYSNLEYFTGDLKLIHETIFKMRNRSKLLRHFPFSENDVYPFSRQLEDVLFSLERSRIIGMENPDFEKFKIKQKGKDYIKEKILPRFGDKERTELESLGAEFRSYCSKAS